MWLWFLFIVFIIVKCNGNNKTNSTRLLSVLQRPQEYQNISKLSALQFPFDLVGQITHVSIDTLTVRTRYNGTTRIKLACIYTTNIWKAAFLRKHPLEPLTYKPLETFVKLNDLVRVHVIDRSIHSPGAYVFGEIFNLAKNNLNINKELVRRGLAESAPTTLSSCDSEYFLLAQEQPQQSDNRLGSSRDRRSVPQHCASPRSEIEQEECQHVIDDRQYNYMTILVSTVAIIAFIANFEA
ncbi:unnamed protein product [Rotaria sordida]|uniref:Uncharacterized protein n=1 Tax=Rotaria sordida TaxID=392033 RepID=A0A814JBJ4_9BILA|nr:unnamed protein product [Rotaria sordida]CAF0979778.1 unnamed protein product [Rotaria sordida]CAF1033389.1 unnamed protein product [Rotaria sordida]CAF1289568.1 unnamed protein product [Rotaria sordida]CAF1520480.1 unnamed protein product [Rotaria sordida]